MGESKRRGTYEERKARAIAKELAVETFPHQRLWDLVRYCRSTLHQDNLVTDEEYVMLAEDHPAVERLEDYDELHARVKNLETKLNSLTEHPCGSDEPVTCCRCGQVRAAKNTFMPDIGRDEYMCWLCAGKHYRGMDCLLAQEKFLVKELQTEVERLEAEAKRDDELMKQRLLRIRELEKRLEAVREWRGRKVARGGFLDLNRILDTPIPGEGESNG